MWLRDLFFASKKATYKPQKIVKKVYQHLDVERDFFQKSSKQQSKTFYDYGQKEKLTEYCSCKFYIIKTDFYVLGAVMIECV